MLQVRFISEVRARRKKFPTVFQQINKSHLIIPLGRSYRRCLARATTTARREEAGVTEER